jgi:glycosyltransferase involved in cell wall biosynthesis
MSEAKLRPRILFVSPVPDIHGGAEKVLLQLLNMADIEPLLLVPEGGIGELATYAQARGIEVHTFNLGAVASIRRPARLGTMARSLRDAWRAARCLASLVDTREVDLVHTNGLKVHAIATLARCFFGMRLLIHIHDIAYTRIERVIWVLLGFFSSTMIVPSRPCWPLNRLPAKVAVIPNGIAPLRGSGLGTSPGPRHPFVFGFAGRIHPFKGIDLLVQWIEASLSSNLDVRFVIRGRAQSGDERYEDHLRDQLCSGKLAAICSMEGWTSRPFEGIDALLVPSNKPDPLPLSIMEAMQIGLPVVGYPAGGIPYLIRHEETGFLVSTPAEFVSAARLLVVPERYRQLSSAARTYANHEFQLDQFLARFKDHYDRTIASRKRK